MKFGFGSDWKEVKRFEKLDQKYRSIVFYSENEYDFIFFKPIVESNSKIYSLDGTLAQKISFSEWLKSDL